MMRSFNNFLDNQMVTAIGIAVFLIFCGFGLAAKADTKWGYAIAAAGLLMVAYTLKVNRIF